MKGVIKQVPVAVVTGTFVVLMLTLSIGKAGAFMQLFESENAKTTSERIKSAVHATSALQKGMLELNLKGKSGYSFYTEAGEKYIQYEHRDFSDNQSIELDEVEYQLRTDSDDTHETICIVEGRTLFIEGGGCDK